MIEHDSLKILSWNLHGLFASSRTVARLERAAARILEEAPDLVLLQEIWPTRLSARMDAWMSPRYARAARPGTRFGRIEGGLAAYVARERSDLVLRECAFQRYTVAAPRWRLREGDGLGGKGIQELCFEGERGGFAVLNTHLQSPYPGRPYESIRRRQLAELRGAATRYASLGPVIAAGDLNTAPGEPLFGEIVPFWKDLADPHREAMGSSTHLADDGGPGGWIDHVVAHEPPGWTVELHGLSLIESSAPDHPYSDHHALHARLRLCSPTSPLPLRQSG